MKRALRYLVEPGDLSLVRSWSAIVMGACMAVAPVLLGMMDVRTALIASVAGAIPSLLFWRQTIEPSTAPRFVAALALLLLGTVASARLLGDPAAFAYLGGWLFANGVMRLATGYREPPNSSVW